MNTEHFIIIPDKVVHDVKKNKLRKVGGTIPFVEYTPDAAG